MLQELGNLQEEALRSLSAAKTEKEISEIRTRFLGRKGALTQLLRNVGGLPEAERREIGRRANQIKQELEEKIETGLLQVQEREKRSVLEKERIDVTLPGTVPRLGHRHPLSQTADELIDLFGRFGFEVARGPEVEDIHHNFDALNIPLGKFSAVALSSAGNGKSSGVSTRMRSTPSA